MIVHQSARWPCAMMMIIIIMMIRITGIFVSGERDYVNPNDLDGDDDHQDDDVDHQQGGRVLWSLVGKMGRKEAAFGRLHACTICNLIITMFFMMMMMMMIVITIIVITIINIIIAQYAIISSSCYQHYHHHHHIL